MQPKDFMQRRPDGRGGWIWGTKGIRRVLYRLPDLLAAPPESWVCVVEGEKDADRLADAGLVATTCLMGASKWRQAYNKPLAGRRIAVLPDNDEPGRKHADEVARSLYGIAAEVRIVELPGLPDKGDVSDWLDQGHTAGDLLERIVAAPPYRPPATSTVEHRSSARRVSHIAEAIIRDLSPLWHRKQKTIFFEELGSEKRITLLWTLAEDHHVDEVLETIEGQEHNSGGPPNYRQRLSLLKDAIAMAASRVVRSLPEVAIVEQDATVDPDQLLDRLVAWLLKDRSFRLDCGTPVSTTYLKWARGVQVGAGWCMCFTSAVFARVGDQATQPELAVQGRYLTPELRYESSRKLAADLRSAGLADPNHTLKVTRVTWRAWLLDPPVTASILTDDPFGNVTDPSDGPKSEGGNTQ